jgi:hypothetical protein
MESFREKKHRRPSLKGMPLGHPSSPKKQENGEKNQGQGKGLKIKAASLGIGKDPGMGNISLRMFGRENVVCTP